MYARNLWYMAGWSRDFAPGALVPRLYLDERIVFYRKRDGTLVALEDRCVHRFAPLSLGCIEGDNLRCMYHGLLFSAEGTCIEIPGQDVIPAQARVRQYTLAERGGWVWIWFGDAPADPATIPDMLPVDAPERYSARTGALDYAAGHALVSANLLDFSHLAYVHRDSFNANEEWGRSRPKRTILPNGVQVDWWVRNQTMPEGMGVPVDEPVDQRAFYQYLTPGVLRLMPSTYPAGAAPASGEGPADVKPYIDDFNGQAVTPVSAGACRYFFSWITPACEGSEAMVDGAFAVASKAFAEDKHIIEAQQAVIDQTPPDRRMMPIQADTAITLFERMMKAATEPE